MIKKKVQLSSKGQVVIPKEIRDALGLEAGDTLEADLSGGVLHLKPRDLETVTDELRGRYEDEGLVEELEEAHRKDIERDEQYRP